MQRLLLSCASLSAQLRINALRYATLRSIEGGLALDCALRGLGRALVGRHNARIPNESALNGRDLNNLSIYTITTRFFSFFLCDSYYISESAGRVCVSVTVQHFTLYGHLHKL